MAPIALVKVKCDKGSNRGLNYVFLNIQKRQELLLVKDQRSFTEKETYFWSWEVGQNFFRREIGVEEGMSTQARECGVESEGLGEGDVNKLTRRETRACLQKQ